MNVASLSIFEKLFLPLAIALFASYFFILKEKSSSNFFLSFLIGLILFFSAPIASSSSSILYNSQDISLISCEEILAFLYLLSFSSRDLSIPEDSSAKDRKSTRLNSSHANISYAVFCLK